MEKRNDGISKVEDIDEKVFLSILDSRTTPSGLPNKDKNVPPAPVPKEVIVEEKGKEELEEKKVVSKRTYKKKKNSEYLDAFMKSKVLKQR